MWGEELNEILRLVRSLRPCFRWSGEQEVLEFLLTIPQRRLICLNLVEAPTRFCRSLRRHATAFVEVNGIALHGLTFRLVGCFPGDVRHGRMQVCVTL